MNFADSIRLRRKSLGLTQRQLASMIEFDVTYLSKLENGRNDYPPSEELIRKLADCLHLNYNELLISSGRVESNAYLLFKILGENYPQFIPFMQTLNQDEEFAKYVFNTLVQEKIQYKVGAQIHLCDNLSLTNTVKDYLDSKCYTRVTCSNSQNITNTRYGLLIKHDSDNSHYNYHAASKTRIVILGA